ncbi:hypothetical protein ACFQ2B_40825 [Streptomyces stramineus]|uniref:Uncharacterized protein n=1 Tax=Streptomyces stramineus TaxID=173861 RepID=A0ABN1A0B4_9ACTN
MTTLPLRDVELLLAEYNIGAWTPTASERSLAESLAFSGLSPSSLRAGLRQAPPGRLSDVLAPVTAAMETTAVIPSEELRPLRRLLDAVAPPP